MTVGEIVKILGCFMADIPEPMPSTLVVHCFTGLIPQYAFCVVLLVCVSLSVDTLCNTCTHIYVFYVCVLVCNCHNYVTVAQ